MHILVIDGGHVEAEFREKFGPAHEYSFIETENLRMTEYVAVEEEVLKATKDANAAFLFNFPSGSHAVNTAMHEVPFPVFMDSTCKTLAEHDEDSAPYSPVGYSFGFCGLPTLLNRSLLEVSIYHEADRAKLAETCAALGTDYRVVADRVGLVTPRVICQIINEACFTVQEGTATMQDVDLGMQLGTSYPRGPFAWANAIGIERVYAVLEAMWHDTHDERYKVCPLLKRQALRGEPFAV